MTRYWLAPVLALVMTPLVTSPGLAAQGALEVTLVADEAEAVLAILDTRAAGHAVGDEQWERLFASEGYRRLKEREAAMGVPFADSAFQAFVRTDSLLARRAAVRETLDAWTRRDLTSAARRAFAYLPEGATIRATVYPVIKPRSNSFVHDLGTDPAIFLYLDPERTAAQFENTVAHELHHVGFSGACPEESPERPERVRDARDWMSGFGEGIAMLAAVGDPDTHPHAPSPTEARAVWDRDMGNLERDMERAAAFFRDLLDGRIDDPAERRRRGFELVNTAGVPQGPFYTVGWHIAATIERELGRSRLVATLCDPADFLAAYNEAARGMNASGGDLPLWPSGMIEEIQ